MTRIDLLILKYKNHETNHILHCLVSILTGGLWLIVWLFVVVNNNNKRKLLEDEIEKEIDSGKIT